MSDVVYVLSGGGAKGSFQLGVMKSLESKGIKPKSVYGTSVGALNAAGFAYCGIAGMERIWRSLTKRSDVLSLNWWKLLWAEGIYSTKPLAKLLDSEVKGQHHCEAVACSVSLRTGETRYTSNYTSSIEEFKTSVLASATIPAMMDTQDGWVDGGVREQTPLRKAIKDGHKNITVILANPWRSLPNPWEMPRGLIKIWYILFRVVDDLFQHEIFLDDLRDIVYNKDVNITVYAPKKVHMDTLDFDPVKIAEAIEAGKIAEPLDIKEMFNE